MGNGLDGRPEGPVMDFATFQELRLDLRADQYPPGNPNDAYDAAVARASERQLEADAAADMMDVALYVSSAQRQTSRRQTSCAGRSPRICVGPAVVSIRRPSGTSGCTPVRLVPQPRRPRP